MQESALDAAACAHLPQADRSKCESGVEAAVSNAVRMIEDYVNPQTLCHPVCPGPAPPLEAVSDWQCPFCEYLAEQAAVALRNKTTDKEVLQFMEQQCEDLPPSFTDQCVKYVDTDGGPLPLCLRKSANLLILQRRDWITKHQFALHLIRDSTVIPNYLSLNPEKCWLARPPLWQECAALLERSLPVHEQWHCATQ